MLVQNKLHEYDRHNLLQYHMNQDILQAKTHESGYSKKKKFVKRKKYLVIKVVEISGDKDVYISHNLQHV